jgi:hypothetical protein
MSEFPVYSGAPLVSDDELIHKFEVLIT